jgi:hypothetical protein
MARAVTEHASHRVDSSFRLDGSRSHPSLSKNYRNEQLPSRVAGQE